MPRYLSDLSGQAYPLRYSEQFLKKSIYLQRVNESSSYLGIYPSHGVYKCSIRYSTNIENRTRRNTCTCTCYKLPFLREQDKLSCWYDACIQKLCLLSAYEEEVRIPTYPTSIPSRKPSPQRAGQKGTSIFYKPRVESDGYRLGREKSASISLPGRVCC
jgi:hypothetical protein